MSLLCVDMEEMEDGQNAACEKDLWVSSRHYQSHSRIEGEMFQRRLIMSIIMYETVMNLKIV